MRSGRLLLQFGWRRDGPAWSALGVDFADRRLLGGVRRACPYFASSPSPRAVALKCSGLWGRPRSIDDDQVAAVIERTLGSMDGARLFSRDGKPLYALGPR